MSEHDPDPAEAGDERPAWRRNAPLVAGLVVVAGLGFAAFRWLVPDEAPPAPVASAPPAGAPTTLPPSPPEPAVANPIETPPDAPAAPTAADLEAALGTVVGAGRLQSMFRLQELPRRIVSTVDNLGRAQASASLWPVNPPAGPFTTDRSGETEVIARANYARYAPYVEMLESLDLDAGVAQYRRVYPLLQQAYEDLGYPGRYFNDRAIEVIDVLRLTPEPGEPLRVRLPEFGADMKPERPWVLYEFEDPRLQQLSAGQRMLLRMGPDQRRRVKAVLGALRQKIAATPPAAPASTPSPSPTPSPTPSPQAAAEGGATP